VDGRPGPSDPSISVEVPAATTDTSGRDRTSDVASLATLLAAAVLDGDHERATTIARAMLERGLVAPRRREGRSNPVNNEPKTT
jgi:hypothetical protein